MPNITILDDIFPIDLDLPSKFSTFRPIQREMADFCLYGPEGGGGGEGKVGTNTRRFMLCGAPPGAGKSLSTHAIGRLSGKKYVAMTATRGLEDQQVEDKFPITNIRGRANYECVDTHPLHPDLHWSCEEGDEKDCWASGRPGCGYFDRVEEARKARGVLTNYQYWMNARARNRNALERKGEPVGLLILDEFHKAMSELARFLGTWVASDDLSKWARKEYSALMRAAQDEEWGRLTGKWVDMLENCILAIQVRKAVLQVEGGWTSEVEAARGSGEWRRIDKSQIGLERVVDHGRDNNWLWRLTSNGISFVCIWPGRYAERYLWSGVETVVAMSGTLRPKAATMMNIKSTDMWFKEWPRQFPAELSPVYWVPTGKMGHKAGQGELDKCVEAGERIFKEWGHKKGLVHSQSYRRAEWLQAMSTWGRYMHINERGEASEMAARFRKMMAPAALVSPSFGMGWDFADEACEWIWIPKLPFPDKSDPVMLARMEDDPDYYNYETAQTFQQQCMRGSRHETDECTTVVTDDAVGNFRKYAKRFMSTWFTVKEIGEVPRCGSY